MRHNAGVGIMREVVDFLVLAAYASEPWEWADRCQFIPI